MLKKESGVQLVLQASQGSDFHPGVLLSEPLFSGVLLTLTSCPVFTVLCVQASHTLFASIPPNNMDAMVALPGDEIPRHHATCRSQTRLHSPCTALHPHLHRKTPTKLSATFLTVLPRSQGSLKCLCCGLNATLLTRPTVLTPRLRWWEWEVHHVVSPPLHGRPVSTHKKGPLCRLSSWVTYIQVESGPTLGPESICS